MVMGLVAIAGLLGPGQGAERPKARPVAMVLARKGRVEIRPAKGEAKAAAVGDLLYKGEAIIVPTDGAATVSVLGDGTRQDLRAGARATVGPKGCTPPEAIAATKAPRPAVARTMKGIRPVENGGRKAGINLRALTEREPVAVTPIDGATVATDRPALAWPAAKGVASYRVTLRTGAGRVLWTAEPTGPRVEFPKEKPALERGLVYRWEATDADSRPVASGEFSVATASELEQLDALKPLADSPDPADRLAAALSYRRLAAFAEALAAFERLARESPDEPLFRDALADLRRRAGVADDKDKKSKS